MGVSRVFFCRFLSQNVAKCQGLSRKGAVRCFVFVVDDVSAV
jgi:hypothetical protein